VEGPAVSFPGSHKPSKALISLVECGTVQAVPLVPAISPAAFRARTPSLVLKENAHAS
jgi:hypothetical protein